MKLPPLFAALVLTLAAQTNNNVKIDNDQVRVLVANEQPHHPSAMHEHKLNRVMIYMGDGEQSFTLPDATVQKIRFRAGDVRWSPAEGPHISETISDRPYQIIEIELKNHPQPFTPSALDPLKMDSKHYKLEFENDQVRVTRVRFGPHEKGTRHQHQLNHVVVYMTDQARGPAGTVHFDAPEIHSEENPLDHPVERISVDIK
jgi:quercetin dioxygenase-like cupin family protein